MRITLNDLESVILALNNLTDNKYDFTLEAAYGGYKLCSHKGSRNVLDTGFITKKDLFYNIKSFKSGIALIKKESN